MKPVAVITARKVSFALIRALEAKGYTVIVRIR
jgi:hypothetical protein